MKNIEKSFYAEREYLKHEFLKHPIRAFYYKKKHEYYENNSELDANTKISFVLAILGLFFIILGIAYIVYEGVHQTICDNTTDIKWYANNCLENNYENN